MNKKLPNSRPEVNAVSEPPGGRGGALAQRDSGLRTVIAAWHKLSPRTQRKIVALCEGDRRVATDEYGYEATSVFLASDFDVDSAGNEEPKPFKPFPGDATWLADFEAERARIINEGLEDVPF